MNHRYEVIVVGAGAAGLAAAQTLAQNGVDFLLLEAQSRVGGRIFSLTEEADPTPIELGAEFIHGVPKKLLAELHQQQIPIYDGTDTHLFLKNGKLKRVDDFFPRLEKVMGRIQVKGKEDRSVHQFIHSQKTLDQETKALFQAFVEGFHAADLHLIGERGLKDTQETGEQSLNGAQMFRTTQRYDLFLNKIAAQIAGHGRLLLQTELKKIGWRKNQVELHCQRGPGHEPQTFHARKLVLTLPLGVLKSPALEWSPRPKALDTLLKGLHVGHVQRIVFRFRERFWENLSPDPVSFLHTGPESYFPTWWSLHPHRTPHLIAWQGGPKAEEISRWPADRRLQVALKTLSLLTRRSVGFLNAQVQTSHSHNWSKDPYALGAYSYIGAGAMPAARQICKPIEDTIYFAGEAAARGTQRATVHGAFDSGHEVVRGFLPL